MNTKQANIPTPLLMASIESITEVITELETKKVLDYAKTKEYIERLRNHTDLVKSVITELDTVHSVDDEEGCGLDTDTCGMDATQTISDEKNIALMKRALDNLADLL